MNRIVENILKSIYFVSALHSIKDFDRMEGTKARKRYEFFNLFYF